MYNAKYISIVGTTPCIPDYLNSYNESNLLSSS